MAPWRGHVSGVQTSALGGAIPNAAPGSSAQGGDHDVDGDCDGAGDIGAVNIRLSAISTITNSWGLVDDDFYVDAHTYT